MLNISILAPERILRELSRCFVLEDSAHPSLLVDTRCAYQYVHLRVSFDWPHAYVVERIHPSLPNHSFSAIEI